MRAFRIPSALTLVASLALLGCGDLGTAPSLDELGPQLQVTVPTSLNPGDPYRLAFLTRGTITGTSQLFSTYSTFVTNEANGQQELADLNTTWQAIVSIPRTPFNARRLTGTDFTRSVGVPIFLLNDTKLVDSNKDLWDGTIDTPLNVFADGSTSSVGVRVWTGTTVDGTVSNPVGQRFVRLGLSNSMTGSWIFNGFVDIVITPLAENHLYGLSGQLIKPIAVKVDIDIKPGSDPNSINLGNKGGIPVAILTTDDFDAADVDPATVTLGNDDGNDTSVATRKNGSLKASLEDVDDDGDLDLILHFDTQALVGNGDLDANTTELILNGETTDGQAIQGSDSVNIVP